VGAGTPLAWSRKEGQKSLVVAMVGRGCLSLSSLLAAAANPSGALTVLLLYDAMLNCCSPVLVYLAKALVWLKVLVLSLVLTAVLAVVGGSCHHCHQLQHQVPIQGVLCHFL